MPAAQDRREDRKRGHLLVAVREARKTERELDLFGLLEFQRQARTAAAQRGFRIAGGLLLGFADLAEGRFEQARDFGAILPATAMIIFDGAYCSLRYFTSMARPMPSIVVCVPAIWRASVPL